MLQRKCYFIQRIVIVVITLQGAYFTSLESSEGQVKKINNVSHITINSGNGGIKINFGDVYGSIQASNGGTVNIGRWPFEGMIEDGIRYIRSCNIPSVNKVWLHSIAQNMSNFSWQYWVASAALLYYIPSEKKSVTLCGSLLLTLYLAWPSKSE